MPQLCILKGAPGTGKTTMIREAGLEHIALSPDHFRALLSGRRLDHSGCQSSNMERNGVVFAAFWEAVDYRIRQGENLVLEGVFADCGMIETNILKAIALGYEVRIIDLTRVVDRNTARRRNELRAPRDRVPSKAITAGYQTIGSWLRDPFFASLHFGYKPAPRTNMNAVSMGYSQKKLLECLKEFMAIDGHDVRKAPLTRFIVSASGGLPALAKAFARDNQASTLAFDGGKTVIVCDFTNDETVAAAILEAANDNLTIVPVNDNVDAWIVSHRDHLTAAGVRVMDSIQFHAAKKSVFIALPKLLPNFPAYPRELPRAQLRGDMYCGGYQHVRFDAQMAWNHYRCDGEFQITPLDDHRAIVLHLDGSKPDNMARVIQGADGKMSVGKGPGNYKKPSGYYEG